MVWSSNFHFKPFPGQTRRERERKKESARARGSPDHAFDVTGEPRAPVRQSHRALCWLQHCADRAAPLDLTFDLAFARCRLRSTDLRPTDLSLWFWFLLLLWWCGSGVLVVVAFDCRSLLPWVELEFRWCVVLGFGCDFEIFCNKICLDAEKIAEKMWKICRKIAFLE